MLSLQWPPYWFSGLVGSYQLRPHTSNGFVSIYASWIGSSSLMQCFIAHMLPPNFSFVGSCGRGPKYLIDEYAVMDTRYWPEDDPAVTWISIVEIVIMTPLCYLW